MALTCRFVATALTLSLVLAVAGCSTGGGTLNPDDGGNGVFVPVDLSSVEARSGPVTEEQVAGRRTGGVNVTARDTDGQPVAGVTIYLHPTSLDLPGFDRYPHAQTDANGQVGFLNVPVANSLRVRVVFTEANVKTQPVAPSAGQIVEVEVREG